MFLRIFVYRRGKYVLATNPLCAAVCMGASALEATTSEWPPLLHFEMAAAFIPSVVLSRLATASVLLSRGFQGGALQANANLASRGFASSARTPASSAAPTFSSPLVSAEEVCGGVGSPVRLLAWPSFRMAPTAVIPRFAVTMAHFAAAACWPVNSMLSTPVIQVDLYIQSSAMMNTACVRIQNHKSVLTSAAAQHTH